MKKTKKEVVPPREIFLIVIATISSAVLSSSLSLSYLLLKEGVIDSTRAFFYILFAIWAVIIFILILLRVFGFKIKG